MTIERQECDISKTVKSLEYLAIEKDKRDKAWQEAFLEDIKTASFRCGNPQIFTGPDRFPYFGLYSPQENIEFESFCISNLKDDLLLENGIGIVINPKENGADWVFSYGDIVNFHINHEFYSINTEVNNKQKELIVSNEDVLISLPSEQYLPRVVRNILRKYLNSIGVAEPKIMQVSRKNNDHITSELAFNLFIENFKNTEEGKYHFRRISWFLPRHYTILSIPLNSALADGFQNL